MKKLCCIILILILLSSLIPTRAQLVVSAKSCILMESVTGKVLYEKNADAVMPMASTTKLFTALMIRECCDLNEVVTVSTSAAQTEGSSAYLKAGEKLTVEQLLYALLLSSGNDAAEVLAEHAFDGDRDRFITYMNQRAKEWGLIHTHFTNPSGLPDDDHHTTASELAFIGKIATTDPVVARIASSKQISFTTSNNITHSYTNHNSLLRMYNYATGLKTGYTKAAGRCLVSSAEKDGVTLICVTLNAPNDWDDHMQLYDYGFSRVTQSLQLPAHGAKIPVSVIGGECDKIMASNPIGIYLPEIDGRKNYRIYFSVKPILFAPITKGQIVGKCYALLDEVIVAEYDLISCTNVSTIATSDYGLKKEMQRIFKFVLL